MPGLCISSTKQDLKSSILLKISSGMTALSGVTNSSRMTILEMSFSSSLAIFFCTNSFIRGAYFSNTCFRIACIGNAGAVKRLGMQSQSFRNLEVQGARLEIQVEAELVAG